MSQDLRGLHPAPDGWLPVPRDLAPMLATAGELPRPDEGWAYEVKWDGVRALVAVEDGRLRMSSRRGNDVTAAYPELDGLRRQLGTTSALLDGEVVAFRGGRPDFGLLQSRMHVAGPSSTLLHAAPVTFLAFDLLHVDGQSLLDRCYDDRRAGLDSLGLAGDHWQVPPAFPGGGEAVFAATEAQGMEGVVAKRRDARYTPGRRSESWLKVKHVRRQSVVVAGWKPGEGGRSGRVGSLLLGVQGEDGLQYAGHVGTGFSAATLTMLGRRLEALRRDTSPFATPVPREHARTAVWVEPELVADVEFTEWTRDGRLRHPSYQGLRNDLEPTDVVREAVVREAVVRQP